MDISALPCLGASTAQVVWIERKVPGKKVTASYSLALNGHI
jgi:hypothetical protein